MLGHILTHAMPNRPDPPPCTPESVLASIRAAAQERATTSNVVLFPRPFAYRLGAVEFIAEIAALLSQAHCVYEGWPVHALPLSGQLSRSYQRLATTAVRSCCDIDVKVARDTAIAWAQASFPTLERDMHAPEATEDVRADLLAKFMLTAFGIVQHMLANGVDGPLPRAYQELADAISSEDM